MLDTFRDRRTLLVTLVSAIAAGPIFLLLIFNLIASQAERARELKLPVVGASTRRRSIAFLERQQVTVSTAPADYDAKIRAGDLDVVLVDRRPTSPPTSRRASAGSVRLVSDRSRDRARASIEQAESLLRALQPAMGRAAAAAARRRAAASPIRCASKTVDLATPQQSGALVLFLVAYYGLFASVMGGMAVALDTTAGERERQSLEPLLMTPARPIGDRHRQMARRQRASMRSSCC